MMDFLYKTLVKPILFRLDPELTHHLAIFALKTGYFRKPIIKSEKLSTKLVGLEFPNPLGLAAGFDKNAEIIKAILGLGYGFCEIGTVTPYPQAGNAKPRLFRLVKDEALINRMGFNNEGHEAIYKRLKKYQPQGGIVGVNIGANKDSQDRIQDYVCGIKKFYSVAQYFTVNISSPNTVGLRNLQDEQHLQILLAELSKTRKQQQDDYQNYVPIFLKIAPDLTEESLEMIANEVKKSDFDGLVVTNTTLDRKNLKDRYKNEAGGLSGSPLFENSTIILAKMRQFLGQEKILLAAGGVKDSQSFLEKIKAGADLVQIYSAMIFEGPFLVQKILKDVLITMEKEGVDHIREYRDRKLDFWAQKTLL